jgi:hypothetical protein
MSKISSTSTLVRDDRPDVTDAADERVEDSATIDAIGPHGVDEPTGDVVLGGGGPDTAPLNFDDDEIYSGRGNHARTGGTTHAAGGDSGRLGPPAEQLSGTNTPSDPDAKKADPDDAA